PAGPDDPGAPVPVPPRGSGRAFPLTAPPCPVPPGLDAPGRPETQPGFRFPHFRHGRSSLPAAPSITSPGMKTPRTQRHGGRRRGRSTEASGPTVTTRPEATVGESSMSHDHGLQTWPTCSHPSAVDVDVDAPRPFALPVLPVLIQVPAVRQARRGVRP